MSFIYYIKRVVRRLSFTILLLLFILPAYSKPSVKVSLDSASFLMGILTDLKVEVVEDKTSHGSFPLFKDCPSDGFIPLQGDSIELRLPRSLDTIELGSGRRQINFAIPMQCFDSGAYRLPEFLYVSGRDTAISNQVAFKVYPVQVSANDSIAPMTSVMDPENTSVFDHVPDFFIDYWWVILLILALVALVIWLMRRYKKVGSILPPKPEPDPYTVAISGLRNLRARKLWENGMEKEYFTKLTDILRVYLDKRFSINAMEMTSRQILDSLSSNPEIKDKREYMRQILNMADFVKFAKVRPLPDDNVAAIDNALRFVEETRPAPVVEEKTQSEKRKEEKK